MGPNWVICFGLFCNQQLMNRIQFVRMGDIQSPPIRKTSFVDTQSFNSITNFGLIINGSRLSKLGHLQPQHNELYCP